MAAYHISPFELWPDTLYEPISFHVFPAVSVTEVMWLVAPLYSLADSTSRSPPVVWVGKEPDRVVDDAVSVPLAVCTRCGAEATAVTVRLNVAVWVGVPDAFPVPVTVIGYNPGVVPDAVVTAMVELPPEVTDVGVNDTVAPVGSPVADRATDWGPLLAVVTMLVVAALPAATLVEGGEAAMVKSGGGGAALTTRVKLWLAGVPYPLLALMVTGYELFDPPAGVPARVAVPLWLSVKVTPLGREPVSESPMGVLPLVVTVKVPGLPMVKVVVLAEVMAGGVLTTSGKVTEWVWVVPVPVTVTV